MKKPLLVAALALPLILSSCKDPAGSRPSVSSVAILLEGVRVDERTIAVGDAIQLSASPRDAAGKAVEGPAVGWTSSNATVASVDAAGTVRGLQPGTAWIRASSARVTDSVRINVSDRFEGMASCAPGTAGIALAVGQAHVTNGYDTPTLCVAGGGTGAEYVLVPFHASRVAGGALGSRMLVELTATGTVSSIGPSTEVAAADVARSAFAAGDRADTEFHLRLRERTIRELNPRMQRLNQRGGLEPSFSTAARVPAVGDLLQLNVRTDSACAQPANRAARVQAIGNRAIIVADTSNPAGGFTADDYRAFAARIDEVVYPLATQTFGEPHDLDANQRVIIFFTRAVNDLTDSGSGFYVGGFFFDRDLFARSGTDACAGSNAGEILYLMVPDPVRGENERSFRRENVERRTLAVIGHELQHLINASRRLHVNKAQVWEETWLNEGLSHVMEELLFYRIAGLETRSNLDASILQGEATRRTFEEYQLDNFERVIQYMGATQFNSIMAGGTLPMRGAAWSLLRYMADRRPGAERDFWNRLGNSKTAGMENLQEVLGSDPADWTHDWAVSLYTDDFVPGIEPRFRMLSWNYRSIVPASRALLGQFNTGYPLAATFLRSSTTQPMQQVNLQSGGAVYYRFGVLPGQQAAIRTSSGGLRAPSKLRLALVRTR